MEHNFIPEAVDPSGTHGSLGDNWLGPQVRLYRQTARVPTLAVSYAIKIPSSRTDDGLGTGRADHAVTFLASKEIDHVHSDFNVTEFLLGRRHTCGVDKNQQVNLAFSHAIYGRLELNGEIYGETRLNQTTPGFLSSPWALTYTVTPRIVIDDDVEVGLTSGGPHRHVFVGATYSIANLYLAWRRR